MKIRIGSRGSALALAQTNAVAGTLRAAGHDVEVIIIQTAGDRDKAAKFADIGAPGVFVREIESALLDGEVDLAVHSYKDLPSRSPDGLVVAAIPERLDAADRLVARGEFVTRMPAGEETVGEDLPLVEGAVVGTASERRRALLRSLRPDLQLESIRGNVPTRLEKLREGPYQAIVLADAGLRRLERDPDAPALGLEDLVSFRLDPAVFVPSPAQGAIALQCREGDAVAEAIQPLHDPTAALPVRAERELLRLVDGGCSLPFGAWARVIANDRLELFAAIEADGRIVRLCEQGADPEELAGRVWQILEVEANPRDRAFALPPEREAVMSNLSGRTILVTRSAEDAPAWAEKLGGQGARTVVFPCIARRPIRDPGAAAVLATALENADWLVLTSAHGAHGVAEMVGARLGAGARVAVVGEATELAARAVFGRVDLVAPNGTVRSLGEALAQNIRDALGADSTRVVAAGAENARLDLEEVLGSLGVVVQRIPVYRTVPASVQEPREDLAALGVNTIFLASPSAVAGLLARAVVPGDARIITIGPSTSEAVRDAGLRVDGEAAARSLEGMIEAMP